MQAISRRDLRKNIFQIFFNEILIISRLSLNDETENFKFFVLEKHKSHTINLIRRHQATHQWSDFDCFFLTNYRFLL
jgi:hypothetical protein